MKSQKSWVPQLAEGEHDNGENLGRRIVRMLPAALMSVSMLISATMLAVPSSAATAGETGGASS